MDDRAHFLSVRAGLGCWSDGVFLPRRRRLPFPALPGDRASGNHRRATSRAGLTRAITPGAIIRTPLARPCPGSATGRGRGGREVAAPPPTAPMAPDCHLLVQHRILAG